MLHSASKAHLSQSKCEMYLKPNITMVQLEMQIRSNITIEYSVGATCLWP